MPHNYTTPVNIGSLKSPTSIFSNTQMETCGQIAQERLRNFRKSMPARQRLEVCIVVVVVVVVVAVVLRGGNMLIESLAVFSAVSFVLTVVHIYRTPVVNDILPFTMQQR